VPQQGRVAIGQGCDLIAALPGHLLVVQLSNDEPLADEHNALLPPDAFHLPAGRPVTHKVYRDAAHPSRLVLPSTVHPSSVRGPGLGR
jgi:hypothetical protein